MAIRTCSTSSQYRARPLGCCFSNDLLRRLTTNFFSKRRVWLSCLLVLLLSGCVQQPTQSEYTVDLRPAISFIPKNDTQNTAAYTIFVDNLDMGPASEYLHEQAALRVLSGSHLIEIKRDQETVFRSKVYLGDGAIKTFTLP